MYENYKGYNFTTQFDMYTCYIPTISKLKYSRICKISARPPTLKNTYMKQICRLNRNLFMLFIKIVYNSTYKLSSGYRVNVHGTGEIIMSTY